MAPNTIRTMTAVAGAAWLVVAGSGLSWAVADAGDDWELGYMVFNLALLIAAALSVAVAAGATRRAARPRLRMAGLVVSGLGVVASVVAWALLLWMTLLGVGLVMVAVAAAAPERRVLALMGAGPLLGLGAMAIGIAAELGRRDEWGDYPVASGTGVVVAAVIIVAALATRRIAPEPS